MLTLPTWLATHLLNDALSLTVCWRIVKHNGEILRGTAHDADLPIDVGDMAGTYRARTAILPTDVVSKSDGSVTNADVEGAFIYATLDDITVPEIEAGLYDQAPADLFLVSWRNPNGGQRVLVSGTLGEFTRNSDGQYRSECRGLTEALKQQIIRTYSARCDVKRFGDHRCRFDVASRTRTATVTAVTDRKHFTADLDAGAAPITKIYYFGGVLKWTSGANDGFESIVKATGEPVLDGNPQSLTFELQDESADDIDPSDTFDLEPACDRLPQTCKLVHDNFVNFRGHGLFAVGRDRLMAGAASGVDEAYSARMTQAVYDAALQEVYDAIGFTP